RPAAAARRRSGARRSGRRPGRRAHAVGPGARASPAGHAAARGHRGAPGAASAHRRGRAHLARVRGRDGGGRRRGGAAAVEDEVRGGVRAHQGQAAPAGPDQAEHVLFHAPVVRGVLGALRLALRGGDGALHLRARDGACGGPARLRRAGDGAHVHPRHRRVHPRRVRPHHAVRGGAGGIGGPAVGAWRSVRRVRGVPGHGPPRAGGDRALGGAHQPVQPHAVLAARWRARLQGALPQPASIRRGRRARGLARDARGDALPSARPRGLAGLPPRAPGGGCRCAGALRAADRGALGPFLAHARSAGV
ncbi:MAG: hypothetical protein AVDCRST_MAG68-2033, partial [uncultured Gemmatimonadetes bacterium]